MWVRSLFLATRCMAAAMALVLVLMSLTTTAAEQDEAREILSTAGVKGGLVVHVACGDGRLTAALYANEGYLVQGLDTDPDNVARARQHIRALGIYGPVSARRWTPPRLPYVDSTVNLLVARDMGGLAMEEVLRVLVPGGAAVLVKDGRWTKTVRPKPKDTDEWTHYLYDSTNNAVSRDLAVGPPRHLQWVGSPKWSRHHDHMASMTALVSANGRIFYIMDEGPRSAILLPAKWSLLARDAYNGIILWKRPISDWNTHLWPLKSGPNQLPRRLVAIGERVYVTLGIDAPVTALDAGSGQTLRTYEGTEYTQEIISSHGVLFLVTAKSPTKWPEYRPKHTYVWDNTRRANTEWAWDRQPGTVAAIESDSGRVLWRKEQSSAPLTLAADRLRVYLHDGDKVVSLDGKTGSEVWASQPIVRKRPFPTGYGPSLVVHQDVVLVSVENKAMTALSASSGKRLWSADHHRGGHASPDDLLVIGGLVWSGAIADTKDSGLFTGRDLHTGEIKNEFLPDVDTYWFHHRCYRSKATDRYIICSRNGIEFVDIAAKHWTINHWVRAGCLYGVMPSNGLLYSPPHPCGCYLESKVFGFNALAPASPTREAPRGVPDSERLERGVEYAASPQSPDPLPDSDDWPTYRHDGARTGWAKTAVPTDLKLTWQTGVGGRLSSVVIGEGKVFVASIDTHTVHALHAESGKSLWSYTADARVDSPPTIDRGRVFFGSADGWVYCLRASDGRLIWRFHAAPDQRQLMAFEQIESPWPVSGSVLLHGGVLYGVAGRSAFLDGGMRLFRLDPTTGGKLSETPLSDTDPKTGENLHKYVKGLDMPTALPDVLSCDGRYVYMRAQPFDLAGVRQDPAPMEAKAQTGEGVHLFSRSGFLDDSWWHRSFWMYGKGVTSGYGAWFRPGNFAPAGRLMVLDDTTVYGFDRKPELMCNASVYEYFLYAAVRHLTEADIQRVATATGRINASSPKKTASASDWALRSKFSLRELSAAPYKWAQGDPPLQARAMVLAGDTLFIAGPPDVLNEEEVFADPDAPALQPRLAEQMAALDGRRGSQLWAVSAANGRKLASFVLDSMPVFDGMAAARGRLYAATSDGKVLCLGAEGAPLAPAPRGDLVPLDTQPRTTAGPPPATADFAEVSRADVFRCDLGYQLWSEPKNIGLALKKLDPPLSGRVTFKVRMRVVGDADSGRTMKNGFLVFGKSAEESALIKCGLRYAMKTAVITQGSLNGGTTVSEKFEISEDRTHALTVGVDPGSGKVTMTTGALTLTAPLAMPLEAITYVGYCSLNSITEFSPITITAGGP